MHGPKKRRPVLQIGGKYLLHHFAGKLWHKNVQHYRRISILIGEARPIEVRRIPRFRQKAAGVAGERGHGREVQQFETIVLGQPGMRSAKVMRQAFPVDLIGMLLAEYLQFLTRTSYSSSFSGVSAQELRGEVERVRRHGL